MANDFKIDVKIDYVGATISKKGEITVGGSGDKEDLTNSNLRDVLHAA